MSGDGAIATLRAVLLRLRQTCRATGANRWLTAQSWCAWTSQTAPAAATQWSTRSLAQVAGCSNNTVQRTWKAHGLKHHLVHRFKVSRDLKFVEKLDVVSLYLSPIEHALVLCCDEKSQVQALDHRQPGLSLSPGRAAALTPGCKLICPIKPMVGDGEPLER
jgi:hypothetical protein